MIDFIAKLLGSGSEFPTIMIIIVSYLVMIWFLFSCWVYLDSKKRFNNNFAAFGFFLFVLIFNFPALVFYFLIRPEHEGEFVVLPVDEYNGNKGVNVPIANFVDEEGKIAFSFELKIRKDLVKNPNQHDMSVDISFSEKVNNSKINNIKSDSKEKEVNSVEIKKISLISKIKSSITTLKNNVRRRLGSLKSKIITKLSIIKKKNKNIEKTAEESSTTNITSELESSKEIKSE